MNKSDTLPVGKIIGVHGIKGEIKVLPYGELEELGLETVYLTGRGRNEPRKVKRLRRHKESFIIELEGVSDRNAAEELAGLEISVPKSDLPNLPEGEYYHYDLVGMDVWAEDGRHLGLIKNVFATAGHDVFEIEGALGEVLIPAVGEFVLKIDAEHKKVIVRLKEGMLPGEQ